MAKVIDHLPSMHETLCSIPGTVPKKTISSSRYPMRHLVNMLTYLASVA
jgi:hypothetical protein